MKTKIKQRGIFFLGIALAVGAAVSSGLIHKFVNANEVSAASMSATLVTDVSQLSVGDDIVIANTAGDSALSITQNGNNRSGVGATLNGSELTFDDSSVEVITLGTSNDNWTLYANTTPGYLYAASSSKNYLRTQATNDTNGEWDIAIDGSNVASIVAQGSNTRNKIQYNPNNGSPIFSCYSTNQTAVKIFKIGSAASLDSLSVSGTLGKTSYYAGESFDPTGLTITANYDDESSVDVTSECTFSPDPLTAGVTLVTASYTEGEVTKTVSIGGFTVSTRSVTSISVLTNPTKTSYTIGQSFDPAGMKIRASYNVGPTNDDYTAYTYAPTSPFDSLGEKTITITSTENASVSTQMVVIVSDIIGGTYTISSNTTTYTNPMNPSLLTIGKSDGDLDDLVFSDIDNVRLGASPNTSHIMIGGNATTGGNFTISLPEGLFASSITFTGLTVGLDATTPTLSINGTTSFTFDGSAVKTLKPYSNSLLISTVGTSRVWASTIEIVASNSTAAATDYGTHFLATTADECSSLSVSLGTWNNLKGLYENADSAVQNVIKAADADVGGSDLEKAIARYTFIAEKYGYDDFMDLGIVSGANQFNVIADNKTNIAIIIVVSLIGVSLLVGHRLIYKRKEN